MSFVCLLNASHFSLILGQSWLASPDCSDLSLSSRFTSASLDCLPFLFGSCFLATLISFGHGGLWRLSLLFYSLEECWGILFWDGGELGSDFIRCLACGSQHLKCLLKSSVSALFLLSLGVGCRLGQLYKAKRQELWLSVLVLATSGTWGPDVRDKAFKTREL